MRLTVTALPRTEEIRTGEDRHARPGIGVAATGADAARKARPTGPESRAGRTVIHIMYGDARVWKPSPSTIDSADRRPPKKYLDGRYPPTHERLENTSKGTALRRLRRHRGTINAATKLKDVEIPSELKQALLAVLRNQRERRFAASLILGQERPRRPGAWALPSHLPPITE